jgi:kynurenine formamidase
MADVDMSWAPAIGADALRRKRTVIDLSREVYEGMPIWPGHQLPYMMVNFTHDSFRQRYGTAAGFETHSWLISEHTGTHADATLEYADDGLPIDQTPLEYYYGEATCIDVSHVRHPDYITVDDLRAAVAAGGQEIRRGDILILETGQGDRTWPRKEFAEVYTGLDREAAIWIAEQGVVNIGTDSVSVDHSDDMEFSAHVVCAEYRIVVTEILTNLRPLIGKRFEFYGLPVKLRQGTGAPIRAIAVVDSTDEGGST